MSDSIHNKNTINAASGTLAGKRLARVLAVQATYCHHALKEEREFKYSLHDVMTSYKDSEMASKITNADEKRLVLICKSVEKDIKEIDDTISEFISKDWKLSRLPLLVLSIMRAAIGEYLLQDGIENAIIINEYVEISKLFNHDGEAGFVNKVLDSAFKKLDQRF